MADYWVTFRIKNDAGYDQRYQGMLDAMVKARTMSWGEPTSFWLVRSEYSIDQLGAALAKSLSAKTDLLVVRHIGSRKSRYFGVVEHLDVLKGFLPSIKELG